VGWRSWRFIDSAELKLDVNEALDTIDADTTAIHTLAPGISSVKGHQFTSDSHPRAFNTGLFCPMSVAQQRAMTQVLGAEESNLRNDWSDRACQPSHPHSPKAAGMNMR
jgi:hypothetical protein